MCASLRWLDEARRDEVLAQLAPLLYDPEQRVRCMVYKALCRLPDLPRPVTKTLIEACLRHLQHNPHRRVPLSLTLEGYTQALPSLLTCGPRVLGCCPRMGWRYGPWLSGPRTWCAEATCTTQTWSSSACVCSWRLQL